MLLGVFFARHTRLLLALKIRMGRQRPASRLAFTLAKVGAPSSTSRVTLKKTRFRSIVLSPGLTLEADTSVELVTQCLNPHPDR